ncbi:FadR/GntR family transcriptional regulator [Nitrincola sp. MINF-07-Sa-05]|uniref:FadR/GntR family transcriptional regulator n=1 Tax=Nitrincola salilacus TaxID=3400273 RepID=UPI003918548C
MSSTSKSERANLVVKISKELMDQITGELYAIGDKLPSESYLSETYGVSRTVVREAIASLRAGGIVETRQGAGAFVASKLNFGQKGFRPIDLARVSSIIEVLEMRIAVESEAAALAAERRSPTQAAKIVEAVRKFGHRVESGENSTKEDFEFHAVIAEATNNSRFIEFLDMVEAAISPRSQLDGPMSDVTRDKAYFENIYKEHKKIADAIYAKDVRGARQAMREHISGTLNRYADLLISGNL